MEVIAKFLNAAAKSLSLFFRILRGNIVKTVVAVVCVFALVFALTFRKKNSENDNVGEIIAIPARPIEPLKEDFLLPDSDDIDERGFQVSREPKKKWTDEEAKKWFVAPDVQMHDELHSANNVVVSEILGEVP